MCENACSDDERCGVDRYKQAACFSDQQCLDCGENFVCQQVGGKAFQCVCPRNYFISQSGTCDPCSLVCDSDQMCGNAASLAGKEMCFSDMCNLCNNVGVCRQLPEGGIYACDCPANYTGYDCSTCAVGYILFNNACLIDGCQECMDGSCVQKDDALICRKDQPLIENCSQTDDQGQCMKCDEEYYLQKNECVECRNSLQKGCKHNYVVSITVVIGSVLAYLLVVLAFVIIDKAYKCRRVPAENVNIPPSDYLQQELKPIAKKRRLKKRKV